MIPPTFRVLVLSVVVASGSSACDASRRHRPAPAPAAAREGALPTADRGAARPDASALASIDPAVCPGAVDGAETHVTDTGDGVEIRITARGRRAQAEIRRRADHVARTRQAPAGSASCLVAYYAGAQAEMEHVAGGVRLQVSATGAAGAEAVRRTAHARAEALQALPRTQLPADRRGATLDHRPAELRGKGRA